MTLCVWGAVWISKLMTCALIGDSLATHAGLGGFFPQCEVRARVGLSSQTIVRLASGSFSWVLISAGSNDPLNPALRDNLERIRSRMQVERVVWVAPANPQAAWTVRAVALAHGDGIATFTSGRDRVHPGSYAALASSVAQNLQGWGAIEHPEERHSLEGRHGRG
jgi:hypothetical protein